MVGIGRIVPCLVLMCTCASPGRAVEPERWWLQPQRILQTNLREIDATMNLDRYVQEVGDFGAAAACFPWDIGSHYERQCHQGHVSLVMGVIDSLLGLDRRLRVTAPPLVEVNHRVGRAGGFEWVALFNHSGQQGKALHPPVPIRDIRIELKPHGEVRAVRLFQTGPTLGFSPGGSGRVSVIGRNWTTMKLYCSSTLDKEAVAWVGLLLAETF
jgi:hypothetical protein